MSMLTSGHCCVCSRICGHIGGSWFCAEHKPIPAATVPPTTTVVLNRRSPEEREAYLALKLVEVMAERDEARRAQDCGHDLEAFERQADALRRVRDLAARAAGYEFDIVPEQIYAALDGTEVDL
jgi:hypothetical protein